MLAKELAQGRLVRLHSGVLTSMLNPARPVVVAALETRIAPAQFFLAGPALTVEKNVDGVRVNESTAAEPDDLEPDRNRQLIKVS